MEKLDIKRGKTIRIDMFDGNQLVRDYKWNLLADENKEFAIYLKDVRPSIRGDHFIGKYMGTLDAQSVNLFKSNKANFIPRMPQQEGSTAMFEAGDKLVKEIALIGIINTVENGMKVFYIVK